MQYEVNFGTLSAARRPTPGGALRIALMGDFSGRASKGIIETGDTLARRKALPVDVDSLDDVVARLAPRIVVPLGDEGTVEVAIGAMDDFHPDQLVGSLPLFEEFMTLRRGLLSKAGFDRAAKQVLSWAGTEGIARPKSRRSRGGVVPTDRKLSDFARLTGRPAAAEASTDDLVRRLVGPFVVAATDSRQDALVGRVDEALSDAMRRVLHHPEFQSAEALWRGVEMLVRNLETGARLQIVLYDISAEELAADLAATDTLEDTALYSLLIEQPVADEDAGPLGVLAGLYGFELAPPHADLLGRMAQLAGAAGAPFVAGMAPDALREAEDKWHPMVRSAWSALRALPAAPYLGLATPRFLLRMPYGKRTDPIDAFAFEEFTRQSGLSGMLWGHPALLVTQCLGQAWGKQGAKMVAGSVSVVGELPVYVYKDADGDQVALPCTERLFTERVATQVASVGVMPVVSVRGRPEVRVPSFGSVAGPGLAGRWAPVEIKPAAAASAVVPAAAAAVAPAVTPAVAPAAAPVMAPATAAPVAVEEAAEDDLDALLASLSAEPAAATADETEADLDALLASLK